MSDTTNGSLLDGIEFEKRRPMDADWSKRKRMAVGGLVSIAATAAIVAGGWFAWQNRPVTLPKSVNEAIATIESGRVDRLPRDRQTQYYAEAGRLLREVPQEEWPSVFTEENRDALRQVFAAQFGESIRQVARGQSTPQEMFANMFRGRGGGGPPRGDGERRGGPPAEGERGRDAADRRQQFASRLQNSFQNGDAQRTGLTGEFFMMMRAQREASGQQGQGGRPGGRGG